MVICTHKTGVMLGSFQVSHVTEKRPGFLYMFFFFCFHATSTVEVDTNYNDNSKMLQQLRRQQRLVIHNKMNPEV